MNSLIDRIAFRLDRLALGTGVPGILQQLESGPARRLWLVPLACLAAVAVGLWGQASGQWWGFGAITATWTATGLMQLTGPLRRSTLRPWRDEREADLARFGHLVGLATCLGLTIAACACFAIAALLSAPARPVLWIPSSPLDWFSLALGLPIVELSVATLAASQRLPSPLPDDDT